jgi:Uma2 family endonuclease
MVAAQQLFYSPEEYLRLERMSKDKHEYHNGRIYAMAGGSPNHVRIATHVTGMLYVQLRSSGCDVFNSDQRVQVKATGLYTYPHVTVVCGEPQYDDLAPDNLLNPALLVEVVSTSTEAYDRGDKFSMYRTIPAFREYVLIAQDEPWIDSYFKGEDGEWRLTSVEGLDAALILRAITCTLMLREVYEGVVFEPAPPSPLPSGWAAE